MVKVYHFVLISRLSLTPPPGSVDPGWQRIPVLHALAMPQFVPDGPVKADSLN